MMESNLVGEPRIVPMLYIILDTEDLHCLRLARQKHLKRNVVSLLMIVEEVSKREIASILRSDLTLIISNMK
jgi:hypothetical protein